MGREEMFATGRLRPVAEPSPDPELERHGFDQVSKIARGDYLLSHRAFRVLACLEGYCWGDDRECWPCNRTIGTSSGGIGTNAVRQALRELEKQRYIRIEPDTTKMRGSRIILLYQLKRPEDRPID